MIAEHHTDKHCHCINHGVVCAVGPQGWVEVCAAGAVALAPSPQSLKLTEGTLQNLTEAAQAGCCTGAAGQHCRGLNSSDGQNSTRRYCTDGLCTAA